LILVNVSKAKEFHEKVTIESGKGFWNLTESGIPKFCLKVLNPRIAISTSIQIPFGNSFISLRLISPSNDLNQFKNAIFSIHGGGYVAMSSASHEYYLRNWSNELNLPIFSVDYSLSPEVKFPIALEECFQAYKWVIESNNCIYTPIKH
jgi:acetyl esterase/lipase